MTVAAPDLQRNEKHDEDVCEYSNSIEALAESGTVVLSVKRLPSVVFSGLGIARDPWNVPGPIIQYDQSRGARVIRSRQELTGFLEDQ